jgi:hypothetical protein
VRERAHRRAVRRPEGDIQVATLNVGSQSTARPGRIESGFPSYGE